MAFVRNVSVTFATKLAIVGIGVATSAVMARSLGPEGKGLYSLAVLAGGMVYVALNLGIGAVSGFMLGRKRISFEELAGNWLSLSVVIGAGILALALALAPALVPRFLPSVPLWTVVTALCAVPFIMLNSNFQMLFRANDDFRSFNIVEILQPAAFLVLYVPAVFLARQRLLEASVGVYLVSTVVGGLGAVLLAARLTRLSFRWNRPLVGESLRFGVQQNLGSFLDFLNFRFDMLLVNYFLDPANVGFYSISVILPEKLWYIPNVLSAVLHPRIAHAETEDQANRDTALVSRLTALIIGAGCLGILLLGRLLVRLLYSDRFLPAVSPLFILLPGAFMMSLARILTSDLTARGFPRANMWAGLVGLVSNVAINLVLIPRMGIAGAALASSISYSLYTIVVMIYFGRITGVRAAAIVVPRAGDVRYLIRIILRETSRVPALRRQK